MRYTRSLTAIVLLVPLLLMVVVDNHLSVLPVDERQPTVVDVGNGQMIEVAPDEVLYKYVISAAPTSQSGTGTPLTAAEYGTRTDSFSDLSMSYDPATQATTTSNQTVPVGDNGESYQVDARITDITENRTWLTNQDYDTDANWDFKTSNVEGQFNGNNRIQFFKSDGTFDGTWGSRGTTAGHFIDPWGIEVNSSGWVYVADTGNHRIQIFDASGTYHGAWGSYGTGPGQFDRPTDVAINGSGYVYVADYGNDRIQIFDASGRYVGEWGSPGSDNGEFHGPVGVAIRNSNGYVYVTDMGNDRVQYFDMNGAYQGQWGTEGTSTGQFRAPTGIAIEQSTGDVIVADTTNCRVQRFDWDGGNAATIGGQGSGWPNGNPGPSSDETFRNPTDVAVASNGTVYVADMGNDRVQYFSSDGTFLGKWGSDGSSSGQFRFIYGIALSSSGRVYTVERGGTTFQSATWRSGAVVLQVDGYGHYDSSSGLYGYWYNPGDKAYVEQDLTIDRGQVTWAGLSLDYYAACRGWGSYMTGFFELFVSVDDPDAGGNYLWSMKFDYIETAKQWYSTGLMEINPSLISLANLRVLAGLRVTQSEWYRYYDILPEGRLDNIVLYIKAKATPEQVNLKMNGVSVSNVLQGSIPVFGQGTVSYRPPTPWTNGAAYANFSWSPSPMPPDPDLSVTVEIDADVTAYARRYNTHTINDTATFTTGDRYTLQNATDVRWETNHYVAVPGGYEPEFFFNVTLPLNRDVDHVGQPTARYTNLTHGWSYGDAGDAILNVSVYEITTTSQNGFWLIRGSSPNMISLLEVWD
ncbi:MAG: hypothetical protein DRO93_03435, partial [Candidatus Thorarchaeota archaeon]